MLFALASMNRLWADLIAVGLVFCLGFALGLRAGRGDR